MIVCRCVRDASVCGNAVGRGKYSLGGVDGVLLLELAELGERRHRLRCAARHALDNWTGANCVLNFITSRSRHFYHSSLRSRTNMYPLESDAFTNLSKF